MAFWDIFKTSEGEKNNNSSLHKKIENELTDQSEEELIKIACISGLLARVAHVDFVVTDGERESMHVALEEWTHLNKEEIHAICKIAVEEIKELAGIENHMYTRPLRDIMDHDERYEVLEACFAVAASDGTVENMESEEIRTIGKGLELTSKHFIAARATVAEKLGALR